MSSTERAGVALPSATATPALAARRWLDAFEPFLVGAGAVFLFLLAWEFYGRSGLVSRALVVPPSEIAAAGWDLTSSGRIWPDLAISAQEYGLGFGLAVLVAVPLGLLAGFFSPLRHLLNPYISVLYATPRAAYLPLLLVWIGIGMELKVLFIFLSAFFPMILNVIGGVLALEFEWLRVAQSFGAKRLFLFRSVVIPGSVPFIATGLRLGASRAFVGLVVAELYASNQGLGFFMQLAGIQFRTADLFFGVLLVAAFGVLSNVLLSRLEARFSRWRPGVGAGAR